MVGEKALPYEQSPQGKKQYPKLDHSICGLRWEEGKDGCRYK